jgi:hypothetical protein
MTNCIIGTAGWSKGRESYDHGAFVVVRGGENPLHGEGRQVVPTPRKVRYA